jgi:ATP-binding cassette subfamily B protein
MQKEFTRGNPLVYLFRKTWRYSEGNRKNIVLFWSMFIMANAITLIAEPLLWAKVINIITQEGISSKNINELFTLLGVIVFIDIIFWSLHGPARLKERANAFIVRMNYRKHLLKGVMTLPMEWHVDHHSGDTLDKVEKGTTSLYAFSESSFTIISGVIHLIISFSMLAYFSSSAAFIVLGMIALTVWITMRFDRVIMGQYKELNRYENTVSESIFDSISNITTVIILRVERLIFKAIVRKVEKPFGLFKQNNRLSETKWFLTSMCCTLMTVLVLGVYFWQHVGAAQGVVVGSVYILITYLGKTSDLFYKFTSMYGEILHRKAKVMNSEELTQDFMTENFINHVLPTHWQTLTITNLTFSYDNEEEKELHLDGISMSINKGERIAFVGETGSGKTTVLKVIRDLYHPKCLELSVDGHIVHDGFQGISQAISLVPQNPEIFATTILDNITLGAEYDMSFIKYFTDMACFTDVADRLPRKFDTSIKEKGINLSGGQQQRLALARGLLACHNKDIVLLDEPTSSLDAATEMTVYQNIFSGFNNKTIISTIHRLHLLPLFDKIYFFSNGKVVGSGTLQELLHGNKKFQTLWQKALFSTESH